MFDPEYWRLGAFCHAGVKPELGIRTMSQWRPIIGIHLHHEIVSRVRGLKF
jgi:hypothetical protein